MNIFLVQALEVYKDDVDHAKCEAIVLNSYEDAKQEYDMLKKDYMKKVSGVLEENILANGAELEAQIKNENMLVKIAIKKQF